AGLSPTLHSSGESSRTGRINRKSNKFLRSVLYKAGVSISSKVKDDSNLKDYSRRILSRYGNGKLVYMKTAAKIARIVFALLKKREPYKPFYERPSIDDKNLNKSKTRKILHKKKSIEKMAKRIMKKKEYLSDELIRQIKSTFEVE
ncbi:MAG: transposase, partial [Candidatus Lokiarchaeota archaeon]|nr:transposase [Candidatus Lokiarchaeota archaeon]